jgi:hypothetical protein
MQSINPETLNQVAETARHQTGGDSRWINAINRAEREIVENPYLHLEGDHLLVLSSTSSNIYTANGSCQCAAWAYGQKPCWHRAAKQLLLRCQELESARQAPIAAPQMVSGGETSALSAPQVRPLVSRERLEQIRRLLI